MSGSCSFCPQVTRLSELPASAGVDLGPVPISLCWQVGEVLGPAASLASWVILGPCSAFCPPPLLRGLVCRPLVLVHVQTVLGGVGLALSSDSSVGGPGDLPGQVASAQCQGCWSFQEEEQGWRRRLGQVVQALVCPWVCYVET